MADFCLSGSFEIYIVESLLFYSIDETLTGVLRKNLKPMLLNTKSKIKIARVVSAMICFIRSIFGHRSSEIFRRNDVFWCLDLEEGIDFSIYLLGSFEPRTQACYRTLLKDRPQAIVFDIGANVGSHTLPLAQLVCPNGGRVIAFEPTVWALNKLKRNLDLNPLLKSCVVVEHAMLVDKGIDKEGMNQEIYSGWPLRDWKGSSLHPVHGGQLHGVGDARVISLDAYVDELSPAYISLLKIDVDGNEFEVVNGGWKSIEKFLPDIIIEWAPCLFQNNRKAMEDLISRFLRVGYNLFSADNLNSLTLEMVEQGTPAAGSINLLLSVRTQFKA